MRLEIYEKELRRLLLDLRDHDFVVFVDSRDNDKLHLASRNVSEWKLVDALAVNVYDVMSHATVVLSQDALSRVVETLK